jgi:hypothetical protein
LNPEIESVFRVSGRVLPSKVASIRELGPFRHGKRRRETPVLAGCEQIPRARTPETKEGTKGCSGRLAGVHPAPVMTPSSARKGRVVRLVERQKKSSSGVVAIAASAWLKSPYCAPRELRSDTA